MDNNKNLYQILNIDTDSNLEEIRLAYKNLARLYHPDAGTHADNEKFFEIQNAWEVLSNQKQREDYDENRNKDSWENISNKQESSQLNREKEIRISTLHGYGVAKPIEEKIRQKQQNSEKSNSNKDTGFLDKLKLLSKK